MQISKDITIEELIEEKPSSIDYLKDKGIRCIRCGEPVWGTLEEAAEEKGFGAADIDGFVKDLNATENDDRTPAGEQKVNPKTLDH